MPFSCEFFARVKYTLVNSSASLNVLSKFPRPNAIPRFGRDYVIVPRTRSAENKSPQEVSHGTRCMVNTRLPNCRSRKWTWAWCPPPKINLFEPSKKCYGDAWEFSKCWPITTGCPQNAKDGSMSNCWYVVSILHQWKIMCSNKHRSANCFVAVVCQRNETILLNTRSTKTRIDNTSLTAASTQGGG